MRSDPKTPDTKQQTPDKHRRPNSQTLHAGGFKFGVWCFVFCVLLSVASAGTKIVFIAGPPSHGPGDHEHRAGCLLLKGCLDKLPGVTSIVCSNGWPEDPAAAFAGVNSVVVFSDGEGSHPFYHAEHLRTISGLMKKGVGLACIHYAVEPPNGQGRPLLDWMGGYFEANWSVNPDWQPDFKHLPRHPVTRGVNPFSLNDEWYFHMRFREDMKGVVPILVAVPPDSTMRRSDGPHEGNPAVRDAVKRGEPQAVAWAAERPDGGRGFGFTGGHYHRNWGNNDFRKLVLNAVLWTAGATVPAQGVESVVTEENLKRNLDRK